MLIISYRFRILVIILILTNECWSQNEHNDDVNEFNDENDFLEIPINQQINKIVKFVENVNSNDQLVHSNHSIINNNSMKIQNKTYEIIYIDTIPSSSIDNLDMKSNQTLDKLTIASSFGVTYSWAKWGKWSKCSRSCGGGVQIRKRNCIERRPSGSDMEANVFEPFLNGSQKGCVGIFKRFRICNDKECIINHTTTDRFRNFLDEQCGTFNDAPFRGKYYDWESYLKESNECELNCKPIGLNYYATLNRTVIDGTPCKRPAIYFTHFYRNRAVCIGGICKAVHSSGAIRGATTKDSHLQCGSVLCRLISEEFTRPNLPFGYLYITTIAAGASNISIIQFDESVNFLVLKSTDDHYIINGEDDPSTDGVYKFHGNLFEYKRGEDYQTITSLGPITRAVDLLILVRGMNTGIKYEYYLPIPSAPLTFLEENSTQWNENGQSIDYSDELLNESYDNDSNLDDTTSINNKHPFSLAEQNTQNKGISSAAATSASSNIFKWKLIGFSECSKTCGGGKQAPIFRCIRDIATRFYTPRRCMYAIKPKFHEIIYQCNTQSCPAYWYTENWSECYCHKDKGIHHRIVKCVQELNGGVAVQVNNSNCIQNMKPLTQEYCVCKHFKFTLNNSTNFKNTSPIYQHLHGSTNTIIHYSSNKNHNTTMNLLKNQLMNSHHHKQKNFRENPTDKTGVWLISNWNNKCNKNCNHELGLEYRTIFCDRTPPYTDRCNLMITPDTTRQCYGKNKCEIGEWFIGKWSQCYGDCFNLYKTRNIYCIQNQLIVNDDQCLLTEKPSIQQKCSIQNIDYCQPKWHYSEWTECSRTCDGGTKKRSVKCLEYDLIENILKESKKCRYLDRQPVYSRCNTEKCITSSDESVMDDQSVEIENNLLNGISSVSNNDCRDELTNCPSISQRNKKRLCQMEYYQKNCCHTCQKN